ncbi:MAG: hypothetical protein INR62_04080 [Rhodospirillales bacterium]|nr:hypothetical protein [Acetobacter sp.]
MKLKQLVYATFFCLMANSALGQVIQEKNLTSTEYQKRFDQHVKDGYRPVKVWSKALGVFDGPTSFGYWATFQKDSGKIPWVARHGLDAATYQQEFNKWSAQGYVPTDMNVARVNDQVRYCVIYDKIPNAPAGIARHNINKAQFDQENKSATAKGYKLKLHSQCAVNGGWIFMAFWQKSQ